MSSSTSEQQVVDPALDPRSSAGRVSNASVLGGGAYGTAMAQILSRGGTKVTMWVREKETADNINNHHENKVFLPDCKLHPNITATNDFPGSMKDSQLVIIVIPTPFIRDVITQYRIAFPTGVPLVCCSKGIEQQSLLTPYELLVEELPGKYHDYICAVSGPSFAKEVANGLPTSVLCAGVKLGVAEKVQKAMSDKNFRVYTGTDLIGAELCGAIKNVLAIACGGAAGFGFAVNTSSLLITRGLLEMSRLVIAQGGQSTTMMGLAGMGDLVLTCTSSQSRNFTLGYRVAKGEKLKDILASVSSVAEGVLTSKSVHALRQNANVEMPICEEVYQVLHEGKSFEKALETLQARPLRHEFTQAEVDLAARSLPRKEKGNSKNPRSKM